MEIQPQNNNIKVPETRPNTTLKIVVLIALIVLLVIGILLPIKLVPNAITSIKDGFASLFGGNTKATLSLDKSEIHSGDSFVLSWTGDHMDNGSYVLTYDCKDGVTMVTSVNQPNETIGCGTQYYFSPTDNTIQLSITSTLNRFTDVPVTLSFLPNNSGDIKTLGDIVITVINSNVADNRQNMGTTTAVVTPTPVAPTPVVRPTPTPVVTPTPVTPTPVVPTPASTGSPQATPVKVTHRVSNPNGIADLSVSMTNVGYLDPVTGAFVSSPTVTGDQIAAVKFLVKNKGDKNTGAWDFTAALPSKTHPTYTAINMNNIGPGDSIEFTLGFADINDARNNVVTITVDSTNKVKEITAANNVASAHIANISY